MQAPYAKIAPDEETDYPIDRARCRAKKKEDAEQSWHVPLTVKLNGRAEAPDWSRGRTMSSGARGETTEHHGPLQRLLAAGDTLEVLGLELITMNRKVIDH